ncbi:MAG: hypothetical protein J1E59_00665 [Treponema sp.]|nr:hypothetical protein [Treponema sp.]
MKIVKQFIMGLMVMALVSFAFAQQKENLDDYLDELNSLIQEEYSLDASYRKEYDEAIATLQAEAQEKINEVSEQEAFPWENSYEYSQRINKQILEIQEQLKSDMDEKNKELVSEYKSAKNAIAEKKTTLWNEIEQKKFHCTDDKVEVLCGAFDTHQKYWPIVVKTNESQLVYRSGELKLEPNMDEIETEFYKIQDLIDNDQIAAEINVRVQQKNPTANTYEIVLVDITLYDSDNEVLYTFPGYSQVIQTVDYMKDAYDPTTEPVEVSRSAKSNESNSEAEPLEVSEEE